ncbi:MAG: cell envelope biogenesis protein OmpA, partial [Pseudomonadota bacterium]
MLWAALGAAFCIATAGATPSDAQETTLSFKDGSFEVTGPLLGFDGQAYRIDTRFGVLTIKAAQVTCQGACPGRGDTQIVRMVGSPAMAEVLMPALIDAFARSLGLSSTAVQSALPGEVTLEIRGSAGEALVRYSIRGGGSEAGFAALAAGEADIVLADRDATPLERAMLLETGLGDMASPLRRRL